jgi:hypothetical protein
MMLLLCLTHAIRISVAEALLWNGFCLNLLFQIFVNMPVPAYQALLCCFALVALYLKVILHIPQGKTNMLHFVI